MVDNSAPRVALVGKACETVTQLLFVSLLPRLLGPASYGRLGLALSALALASVAISFGTPSAFARFLPAAPEPRRLGLARTMTLRLLRWRGLQLIGVLALLLALRHALPAALALSEVALLFVAIAFDAAALLGAQVALGLGRSWIWSYRFAVFNAALLLAVPLLHRAAGAAGLLAGVALAAGVGLAFSVLPVLHPLWNAERGVPAPEGTRRYVAFAGAALLLNLLTFRGPVLATGGLGREPVETGFAALAAGVASAAMLALHQVFVVSLPELVDRWRSEPADAERRLRRLGWLALATVAPVAVVGALTLGPLLPRVAGAGFAPAVPVLVPVVVLLPLLPLPLLGGQGAALQLRPELAVAIQGAGAAAFAVAALVLVPVHGALGATTALAAAIAAAAAASAWSVPAAVPPRLLAAAAAAALLVLVVARSQVDLG